MPLLSLNHLRSVAESVRPIAIPIRTTRVEVRKKFWPDGPGLGEPIEDVFVFPAYTKVKEMTLRDVAASGGKVEVGDVEVGPVTPKFGTGGWSVEQLAPASDDDSVEIKYVLSGGVNGEFRRIKTDSARPFRIMLLLRRTL